MEDRNLSPIDHVLASVNNAMTTILRPGHRQSRRNPATDIDESQLSRAEKRRSAGLMRVNHAGEVAAQGLYQGHAVTSRNPNTAAQMRAAAQEELDHLGWCEERLVELGSRPSVLSPIWYGGALLIGAVSGTFGDRWSLGFVEETERQVSEHLTGHLNKLPNDDMRSRAIVSKMRDEEEQHGANAKAAGAATLPKPIRAAMRASAKVMTNSAYWI